MVLISVVEGPNLTKKASGGLSNFLKRSSVERSTCSPNQISLTRSEVLIHEIKGGFVGYFASTDERSKG